MTRAEIDAAVEKLCQRRYAIYAGRIARTPNDLTIIALSLDGLYSARRSLALGGADHEQIMRSARIESELERLTRAAPERPTSPGENTPAF